MNRADEKAAKLESTERPSAGGAAGSDDSLNEQLRVAFKEFQRPSPQPKPREDLHEVLLCIGRHLNNETLALKTIYDRLLAIDHQSAIYAPIFTAYPQDKSPVGLG